MANTIPWRFSIATTGPLNGLKVPYLAETKVQGIKQTEKIEVEEVAVNAHVEDSRFAKLQ
jgi:hypothetical protein